MKLSELLTVDNLPKEVVIELIQRLENKIDVLTKTVCELCDPDNIQD